MTIQYQTCSSMQVIPDDCDDFRTSHTVCPNRYRRAGLDRLPGWQA